MPGVRDAQARIEKSEAEIQAEEKERAEKNVKMRRRKKL
jgi:hypothetical protein